MEDESLSNTAFIRTFDVVVNTFMELNRYGVAYSLRGKILDLFDGVPSLSDADAFFEDCFFALRNDIETITGRSVHQFNSWRISSDQRTLVLSENIRF